MREVHILGQGTRGGKGRYMVIFQAVITIPNLCFAEVCQKLLIICIHIILSVFSIQTERVKCWGGGVSYPDNLV